MMTKEKIIERLECLVDLYESLSEHGGYPDILDDDDICAIKVAIKALGAEPCTDAISRQAAIKVLNKMDRYVADELILCDTERKFPKNEVFIVDDVYEEIVEQLPSIKLRQNYSFSDLSDMTNGEILKILFPSITEEFNNRPDEIIVYGLDVNEKVFQLDWWNKKYEETRNDDQ